MKNIKKILSYMLIFIAAFCILGVTSCSIGSKNLYVKRTRNGVERSYRSSTKQMSYKLSNGISVDLVDGSTADDQTLDLEISYDYEITVYTSDYKTSITDSKQLSKDLFGIGLSISSGGFQDNNYNASTAVLYASTSKDTDTSETTNLSTLVSYVGNEIDVTKIGEIQNLTIRTEVLKHESEGSYIVDSTYPTQITSVSLVIRDDEEPYSDSECVTVSAIQEDFIDKVLVYGDDYTGQAKAIVVQQKLDELIEDKLREFVHDNYTTSNNISIKITYNKEYDYANLEVTSFKDTNYYIPFTYILIDDSGNESEYEGNLRIVSNEQDLNITMSNRNSINNVFGDESDNYSKEKLEKYFRHGSEHDYVWYTTSVDTDDYNSIDLVSNYTVSGGDNSFGKIDKDELEKAGKDTSYLLNLLKNTYTVHYTKKYKNHTIVDSDGNEQLVAVIRYSEDAKFSRNYTSNTYRIMLNIIVPSEDITALETNFKEKLKDYLIDSDDLENDITMKIRFTKNTSDLKVYNMSLTIIGKYHTEYYFDFSLEKDKYSYIGDYIGETIEFTVSLANTEE